MNHKLNRFNAIHPCWLHHSNIVVFVWGHGMCRHETIPQDKLKQQLTYRGVGVFAATWLCLHTMNDPSPRDFKKSTQQHLFYLTSNPVKMKRNFFKHEWFWTRFVMDKAKTGRKTVGSYTTLLLLSTQLNHFVFCSLWNNTTLSFVARGNWALGYTIEPGCQFNF